MASIPSAVVISGVVFIALIAHPAVAANKRATIHDNQVTWRLRQLSRTQLMLELWLNSHTTQQHQAESAIIDLRRDLIVGWGAFYRPDKTAGRAVPPKTEC
jgi:hypothetical protein